MHFFYLSFDLNRLLVNNIFMSVIFYIRGLFHENNLKNHGNINNTFYRAVFNEIYKLDIRDYRQEINEIQKLNLSKVGCRVIVNSNSHITDYIHEGLPYSRIPKHTIDALMSLADSDILIPLDDDDWVSPDILNYPFDTEALNIWSTSLLTHRAPYCAPIPICKPLEFDADLTLVENQQICRSLLSNCYGIPAKYIKYVITNTNSSDLNTRLQCLLQLHSRVRSTIRDYRILSKENIHASNLSVYVRHFGNNTEFGKWTQFNEDVDKIRRFVMDAAATQKSEYITSNHNLWFADYYNKLLDLNRRLVNNMRG